MIKQSLLYLLKNLYKLPSSSHFWIIEHGQEDGSLASQISLAYQEIANESYQGFSLFKYTNQDDLVNFLLKVKEKDFVAKCFNGRCIGPKKLSQREEIEKTKFYAAEHGRCAEIKPDQLEGFLKSFTVNYSQMQELGDSLTKELSQASHIKLITGNNNILEYSSPLKEILNYSGQAMRGNIPTGEVFSEAADLTMVNGQFQVIFNNQKFIITVKKGVLVSHRGPQKFTELINKIKLENKTNKNLPIRELGFGINQGASLKSGINQSIYLEKIFGTAHISLGPSHYRFKDDIIKKDFPQSIGHHDLLLDLKEIYLDGKCIFKNNKYLI